MAEKETKLPDGQQQNKMGVMPVGRLLFSMSLPMIISMLVQACYNIVDSYFVAQISTDALTAISLAFPLQMLMISVAVGTGVGINSYISRSLGAGNVDSANRGASNGLFLLFASAMVFLVLGLTVVKPFFALFVDDPQIIEMGSTYLRICMVFGIGIFIQLGCERILQSMGKTLFTMTTQLIGAVTNIVLDPIMIFGLAGFPEMGIAGAAIATVIGQWVAMIAAIIMLFFKKHEVTVSFKGFRPDRETIGEIYRVGLPSIIMQSIGSVMTVGLNAIISRILISDIGVAIIGVYFKMQSIIFMPLFGLTNASMSIFAYNYGARNRRRFTHSWRLTLTVAIIIMSLGTLLFYLFPQQIVSMFDSEGTITSGGVTAFKIISLSYPVAAYCITCSVTFQAVGKGLYSMFTSLVRQIIVLLPAAYLIAVITNSLDAIWFSFLIAEVFSAIMSTIFILRLWKRKISRLELPASDIPAETSET